MEYKKATATIVLTIFLAVTARSSSGTEKCQLPERFLKKASIARDLASIPELTEYIDRHNPNLDLKIDIIDIDDMSGERLKITAAPLFIAVYNYFRLVLNIQTPSYIETASKQTPRYWLYAI